MFHWNVSPQWISFRLITEAYSIWLQQKDFFRFFGSAIQQVAQYIFSLCRRSGFLRRYNSNLLYFPSFIADQSRNMLHCSIVWWMFTSTILKVHITPHPAPMPFDCSCVSNTWAKHGHQTGRVDLALCSTYSIAFVLSSGPPGPSMVQGSVLHLSMEWRTHTCQTNLTLGLNMLRHSTVCLDFLHILKQY